MIYAISDLHLGLGIGKGMERFGSVWREHLLKLQTAWEATIREEDTVLLPGDISWASDWAEFIPDLHFLAALPGHKIISKGNHDYYWKSKTQLRQLLPPGFTPLDHSLTVAQGYCIAAIKGWLTPGNPSYGGAEDTKLYARERGRLEAVLQEGEKMGLPIIVQMHYPPFAHEGDIGMREVLEAYKVQICVYGHLHGGTWRGQTGGHYNGIRYHLISADYLQHKPLLVVA
ncbi:MAG: metallophosphoesterase [Symbiobacteriaceae bacterium]|nr:metallophosphoesterase [Symbiobacteriaceae bacterium]